MLTTELFEEVLLAPARGGCSSLKVLSGYATAALAYRHLKKLESEEHDVHIQLVVGMFGLDGVPSANHDQFLQLTEEFENFSCYYLTERNASHAKVYCWEAGGEPVKAFCGSANYSVAGFIRGPHEAVELTDPHVAHDHVEVMRVEAVDCQDATDELFSFYDERKTARSRLLRSDNVAEDQPAPSNAPRVTISLLDSGKMPSRSGLNWGQREGREPNQAYLPIPAGVYNRTDFPLPTRGEHFLLLTDDGQSFVAVRAQDNGKAIETPADNSELGRYFRRRLGLADGAFVRSEDLEGYGRTDYDLIVLDDETLMIDFSV